MPTRSAALVRWTPRPSWRFSFFSSSGLDSCCQSFADFSRSRWTLAKDSLMDTRRFHAQIRGNVGAGFSKSLRERSIKLQPERSEGAKAPIAREHVLSTQHRISRKAPARDTAQRRRHAEPAHADERDFFRRDIVQQLVDKSDVVALRAGIRDQWVEMKRHPISSLE